MTLTPQEVFSHHLQALADRDIDALSKDYSADALILTPRGALEGTAGVQQFYRQAFQALPDAQFHARRNRITNPPRLLTRWGFTAPSVPSRTPKPPPSSPVSGPTRP